MTGTCRQRLRYVLSDFLSANVALCLFNMIRYYTLPYNYGSMSLETYYKMPMVVAGQVLFPVMMVALYALSGFYNEVFFKSRASNLINTVGISLLGAVLIFFIALFNDSFDDRLRSYEMVLILWGLLSVIALIPRSIINRYAVRCIRQRRISFNTLIVGTSEKALRLAEGLNNRYPNMGFNVVGFVNDYTSPEVYSGLRGEMVVDIDSLPSVLSELSIHSFIIAQDYTDMQDTLACINRLLPLGKSVYLTPDIYHLITLRPRTQMVSGEVLIDVSKSSIPASTLNIKRVSDIVVAAVTLLAISPLLAAIAAAVKRSSPGPIFYKQERIGYNKKPFTIYKFRTMYTDSEANGPALSSADDPRITPAGHTLRKYRLDELPQFWNVLKGDMSLVGPRPEREFYLRQIIERAPYYNLLHQVRPGITSWGMVKYGYAGSVEEMIERAKYDLLYIDNVSLAVDLKILLYTVETVVTGKGV